MDNQSTHDRVDPRLSLNGSAVLQLLLFAGDGLVRDAAARTLEQFIRVDEADMLCHDRPFSALPYAKRVSAMVVASMYDNSVEGRGLYGKVPHIQFEWEAPAPALDLSSCIFRHKGGRRNAWRNGGRTGPRRYFLRDTFVLPRLPEDIVPGVRRCLQLGARWQLESRSDSIVDLGPRTKVSRAKRGWQVPTLVGPDGTVICELPSLTRSPFAKAHSIDAAMLLRLAASAPPGSIIAFKRCGNGRQRLDFVASLEFGELQAETPVLVGFAGTFHTNLDIEGRLGVRSLDFPVLGGRTVDCLDAIARRVGVWHGCSLRGSFMHHPLRHCPWQEVA